MKYRLLLVGLSILTFGTVCQAQRHTRPKLSSGKTSNLFLLLPSDKERAASQSRVEQDIKQLESLHVRLRRLQYLLSNGHKISESELKKIQQRAYELIKLAKRENRYFHEPQDSSHAFGELLSQ